MTLRHTRGLARGLVAGTVAALIAGAALAAARPLAIEDPWARPTPPAARTGAGYLTVRSAGPADRLVGAASPVAERVEVHEMSMDGGIMRMRPLPEGVAVPAGGAVTLRPGGVHLMFMGLKAPLKEGETVPVTLRFQRAGEVAVGLKVRQPPPR